MRITLVHNPGAGESRSSVEQLLKSLRDVDCEPTTIMTERPGWESALEAPGRLVVVSGGDGTVAAVAKQLAGRDIPLALLPLGTANNIAQSLGGTPARPDESFGDRWRSMRPITLDIGVVSGPWGEDAFLESVGCGVFADLLVRELQVGTPNSTSNRADRVQQARRELADALADTQARRWRVTVDGVDRSGSYLMVETMNIAFVGPSLKLAADSKPDDGELDVVFLREEDRGPLDAFLRAPVSSEEMPLLLSCRAREVELDATPDAIHIDDQVPHAAGSTTPTIGPVRVRLHRKLTVLVS